MINPLRSEAEAFRFLIASIVYFGAIVIAAVINKWAGVAVFVLLTAGVFAWWLRARRYERPEQTVPRPHAEGEHRILVVANETVAGRDLLQEIERRATMGGEHEVLVVSPALAPRIRFLVSDVDGGIRAAEERMRSSVDALTSAGVANEAG